MCLKTLKQFNSIYEGPFCSPLGCCCPDQYSAGRGGSPESLSPTLSGHSSLLQTCLCTVSRQLSCRVHFPQPKGLTSSGPSFLHYRDHDLGRKVGHFFPLCCPHQTRGLDVNMHCWCCASLHAWPVLLFPEMV